MPSFPTRWYYDVLRALDYLRLARPERDERCTDAIDLLRAKVPPFGLWKLELTHQGPTPFELDGEHEGFPSRWITLRAARAPVVGRQLTGRNERRPDPTAEAVAPGHPGAMIPTRARPR